MNILDRFTTIDDLLVTLLERIGGVTEEDTHFFSYPNDGTRATITKGTTTLDFMGGTVMSPAGGVSNLGNSLRARGREYCRSLSLQADRDIIIQIGTKSKIPVFAGTWFKVAHLRFTDLKIIAAESTRVFAIACTNPDAIEMVGESYVKDPVDVWGKTATMGNTELAVRTHAPPLMFDRRGDVIRWIDFESATENYYKDATGARSNEYAACGSSFSLKATLGAWASCAVNQTTNDFHVGRVGVQTMFSTDVTTASNVYVDLYYRSGTFYYRGRMTLDLLAEEVSLMTPGVDPVVGTFELNREYYNFSTIKLVVDLESKKYVRGVVFGTEIDISEHSLVGVAAAGEIHLQFGMQAKTLGTAGNFYIDSIILTESEPL